MTTSHNQMWATCTPCNWTWIVAYLPMEVSKLARMIQRAHCPKCGIGKGIKIASNQEIETAIARGLP